MQHPQRKKVRLADYDYSQPGAYFITVCVKDHKCLLGTVVGADDHIGPQVRLTSVGRVVEKYLRLIPGVGEFVVMPNHVHMMLHVSAKTPTDGPMWSSAPTDRSVSDSVRTWKTLITKELGRSIWQRSYYDRVIRDEKDYLAHVQYIADNPAKWYDDDYYTRLGDVVKE